MVLVNSESLTKISLLKTHVNWFIVLGCVKLHDVLSEKLDPAFTSPLRALELKKYTHEFDPDVNFTSQAVEIWFDTSFRKRTVIKLCIKILFHRWVITKDISEKTLKTCRQLFFKKKIETLGFMREENRNTSGEKKCVKMMF